VLLEDGACVRVRGKAAQLVRGQAWIWHTGHDKERLKTGTNLSLQPEVTRG
jgi:hypothetical protein